jgi:hypothetical protein
MDRSMADAQGTGDDPLWQVLNMLQAKYFFDPAHRQSLGGHWTSS